MARLVWGVLIELLGKERGWISFYTARNDLEQSFDIIFERRGVTDARQEKSFDLPWIEGHGRRVTTLKSSQA